MTPVALSLLPNVIVGLSDDGIFNVKLNSSSPSTILSAITGTLTSLVFIPLPNVAVSVVLLKSTPPVSQIFFNPHIMIHIILLPSADTGDCCDGVTVTLNAPTDVSVSNSRYTVTNPVASDPVNRSCVKLTLIPVK